MRKRGNPILERTDKSQSTLPSATDVSASAISSDFRAIFNRLRKILAPHADRLIVSADSDSHYCLDVPHSPRLKKSFPVAWVKVSKAYVSFHFIPVYMFPKLRDSMSDALRARMQGKSCFNFKTVDETLFTELKDVTRQGLALSREAGFAS
jgi:hypothetical protein